MGWLMGRFMVFAISLTSATLSRSTAPHDVHLKGTIVFRSIVSDDWVVGWVAGGVAFLRFRNFSKSMSSSLNPPSCLAEPNLNRFGHLLAQTIIRFVQILEKLLGTQPGDMSIHIRYVETLR